MYDDSPMRRYVLSSHAHNIVLVDGKGQDRRSSYEWQEEDIREKADFVWNISDACDYCEGYYNEAYDGIDDKVLHRRSVYFLKKSSDGLPPMLIVVDRLSAKKEHLYEALWHIDSEVTAKNVGCIQFADLDLAYSAGEAQIIIGQEEPVQGFAENGREIPCVSTGIRGNELRMVTVLMPHTENGCRITNVEASRDIKEQGIELTLEDGRVVVFDEKVLCGVV
jgi:hypothetical protein